MSDWQRCGSALAVADVIAALAELARLVAGAAPPLMNLVSAWCKRDTP